MINYNTKDHNPNGVSIPADDFFSFLDKEIYFLGSPESSECRSFLNIDDDNSTVTLDSFRRSKLLFCWRENGYVICNAQKPDHVLTIRYSYETDSYFISCEPDCKTPEQLWDITAYNEGKSGYGISVRSASKFREGSLYISFDKHGISLTENKKKSTRLMLCSLSDWTNFGLACMQYLGWIYITGSDVKKAISNYYHNISANLSSENILSLGSTELIVYQSGGNFRGLRYVDVSMDGVACEAIAVCNALRLLKTSGDSENKDFFRITAEFELSGLYDNFLKKLIVNAGTALGIKRLSSISTLGGSWGGDPDKIKYCLEAHNVLFKSIHIKDRFPLMSRRKKSCASLKLMDEGLKDSVCAVVSYNFSTLHQAIHTFSCIPSDNKLRAFNRFCNHSPSVNYLNEKADDRSREIYSSLSDALIDSSEPWFYTGYLLYG